LHREQKAVRLFAISFFYTMEQFFLCRRFPFRPIFLFVFFLIWCEQLQRKREKRKKAPRFSPSKGMDCSFAGTESLKINDHGIMKQQHSAFE
jgi:hypothetical protein